MSMINSTIMQGRLVRDPKIHTNEITGTTIASFSIANGDWIQNAEHTNFIECVCFKNNATRTEKFLQKGTMIVVEGKLRHNLYKKKDGTNGARYQIIANNLQIFDKKKEGEESPQENSIGAGESFQEDSTDYENFLMDNEIDSGLPL